MALISQLYLHYINGYTMIWEMKIISPNVLLLCLHVKNFPSIILLSFVDQLVGRALHPSFYCMLAFAQWIFVLAENYQVKFCQTLTNYLKSIL